MDRSIPADGNQRSEWDAGRRFDFSNSDYRQARIERVLDRVHSAQ